MSSMIGSGEVWRETVAGISDRVSVSVVGFGWGILGRVVLMASGIGLGSGDRVSVAGITLELEQVSCFLSETGVVPTA